MKHVIFGGDGFVGRHLAKDLALRGEEVVVADIVKSKLAHYSAVKHVHCDVTDSASVAGVPIGKNDVVYNLAAKMLAPIQTRANRYPFFWPVNTFGAGNIMAATAKAGSSKFVQFTTDMVYGHTVKSPQSEDHPIAPLGEYGASKVAAENLAKEWRKRGMNVSIFRPRLIIGPGRLGILEKLFKLVDYHLPVPMIGSGHAPYQFISVYDCAEAARLAGEQGCPNGEFNLGSSNPPSVRQLLGGLIKTAGSKSILVPTPGFAVKATLGVFDWLNLPIMDPEQYLIADEHCVRDTTACQQTFGWSPKHNDIDMLNAAYREYREAKSSGRALGGHGVPAE
jgi:dTDP-glucose 4,6-dehydratase